MRVGSSSRPKATHRTLPDVGRLIEALAQLAPAQPVQSLRQGTWAEALRTARTC